MSDPPKVCPNCHTQYKWYESECPQCHVALVEQPDARLDELPLVPVFQTEDPGVLPLATMALDAEHIEYVIGTGGSDMRGWTRAGSRPTTGESVTILVAPDVADKARDLLVDLEDASAVVAATASATAAIPADPPDALAIQLQDSETGAALGRISEPQLQFLLAHLEQEDTTDKDYYIDAATLDMLDDAHADPALMAILRHALEGREGIDVRWVVP